MKAIIFTCLLVFATLGVQAQTPTKKLGKPQETESGQVKTDTSTSRTVTGSSYGAAAGNVLAEDSIKVNNQADSVVLDQPVPKGK